MPADRHFPPAIMRAIAETGFAGQKSLPQREAIRLCLV